jgi:hypothetical protein
MIYASLHSYCNPLCCSAYSSGRDCIKPKCFCPILIIYIPCLRSHETKERYESILLLNTKDSYENCAPMQAHTREAHQRYVSKVRTKGAYQRCVQKVRIKCAYKRCVPKGAYQLERTPERITQALERIHRRITQAPERTHRKGNPSTGTHPQEDNPSTGTLPQEG